MNRRDFLRSTLLGGLALAGGTLAACEGAAPPPTPRPIPTPPPRQPRPTPQPAVVTEAGSGPVRFLLEAEDFVPEPAPAGHGWQPIRVGQGNYMVDSIGASHVSGEMLLHAPPGAFGARAMLDREIPQAGRYRVWARYEYPYPGYGARVALHVDQPGRSTARLDLGGPEAMRLWFFNLHDAPWHDLPNGVEGLVAEPGTLDLTAGPARFTLEVVDGPEPPAARNLDVLLFSSDLDDDFRDHGTRAYPILDELGAAAASRAFIRITNPADSGESFSVEARYALNRVPWTLPAITIDRNGASRSSSKAQRLEPGDRTPWLDLSCRDTTHPGHLQLTQQNNSQNRRASLIVEVASAPDEAAVLRTLEYREEHSSRLLLNLPPYLAKAPQDIRTGEETLQRIVEALEAAPAPVGKPPVRTLIYAGLGDDAERNLTSEAQIYRLYRRLFFLLGANAFNRLGIGALAAELQAMRDEGRQPSRYLMAGDFRWFPSGENIQKLKRDVDAAQARPYLRGVTYGDEVSLRTWAPKEHRDEGLRAFLHARGLQPDDVLPDGQTVTPQPDDGSLDAGSEDGTSNGHAANQDVGNDNSQPDSDQNDNTPNAAESAADALVTPTSDPAWGRVRYVDGPADARRTPRLYVESHRYLVQASLDRLAAASAKLRAEFGDDILYGPNYSPHPFFWPEQALFVDAFRRGAINRASHSDYWWQVSELGPQMTGFLLDVLRCGLRDGPGQLQAYVMPHSPGNTDADVRRGAYVALAHGARVLDFFQVSPEQANTENYIRADDVSRYRTVRDLIYEIGAVDDLLADGKPRPAPVAIVLCESTDLWDRVTPGQADGLQPAQPGEFPSIAYNLERKCLWTALRHAQVPVDFVTEDDLANGSAARYRVLYLAGDHLSTAAAQGLAAWVQAGGTLISTAGGGLMNDYGEPLPTLLPVFGVREQTLEKRTTFIRPRIELPRLRPLDTLTVRPSFETGGPLSVPVLAFRQRMAPASGAEVIATFSDGAPAAVRNRSGKGTAILWGALLGLAYVQSGFTMPLPPPDRGPGIHTPLTGFDAARRQLVVGPAGAAAQTAAAASDPLVETGLLETERAVLVPLASLRDGPHTVDVVVHGAAQATGVRSVRRGPLAFQHEGDTVRTSLSLDPTDFLIVER
ncbi:MAG: hypothetical protein IT305_04805 [Chloroflexi bacterium]|nr:hypothetical protein [Chloroflexota bacterium]